MNIENSTFRIIAGIIMIGALIWGYWWIVWSLAIIFLFIFPSYYEIIAWGALYDALYGITLTFTIASLVLYIISFILKKYLFAYAK